MKRSSQHKGTDHKTLSDLVEVIASEEALLREGGGKKGQERQRALGRMTARERIAALLDDPQEFFELGLWEGYKMYPEWGELPAAGVVAGIGPICGRHCLIVANDATVKAGAMFPQSVKKVLRAQKIAYRCRLPTLFLVDSSGVFLPLQDEIFPDEDDFGRIFRNNAIFSAEGIPQIAAVMGNCIAGGAYLPVLCDKLLMTEGSGLYLAGPALVKAAIGQVVDAEELGGAKMHASVSGTVDFYEPNDTACLKRLRDLVDMLPESSERETVTYTTEKACTALYDLVSGDGRKEYDVRDVLRCIVDAGSLQEYKEDYGKTIVTAYAKVGGIRVGIVANQRIHVQTEKGEIELGGVLYADSADKAARFVMDCNQSLLPILFFQDVVGFMVGKAAEQSGIIRAGAKLVNVVSNSVVPKITVVIGNSFGAGNYALCGKAYDPNFIVAWPNAKYAVMGADQAAGTLLTIQKKAAEKHGKELDASDLERMQEDTKRRYQEQMDIRYGAARGWVDAIVAPHKTRDILIHLLKVSIVGPQQTASSFKTGILQV